MRASTRAMRLDQPLAPGFGLLAERALHLPERLPPLAFGLGVDQVGQALDGGQIELAVLKRAPGELARLGRPQAVEPAQRGKGRGNNGAAAVQLELGCVLAGLAVGAGKPERQRLVDHLPGRRIAHAREPRLARLWNLDAEGLQRVAGARAGNAHDGDGRRQAAGGEGVDGGAGKLSDIAAHRSAGGEARSRGGGTFQASQHLLDAEQHCPWGHSRNPTKTVHSRP